MTPKADPIVKELSAQLDGDKIDGEQKMQVSEVLGFILREKGKSIQEAISKQVYSTLTSIIEDRKRDMNDKVIVNSAVAIGFLSAYSSDPAQMKELFSAFDDSKDFRVILGIKLGILMNGSDKIPDLPSLQANAKSYICEVLKTQSGIVEIDGKDIKEGRPEEEIFRFDGALETLGHIMNTFLRRFYKSGTPMNKFVYAALNDSGVMKTLAEEEDFMPMSDVLRQVLSFIMSLNLPSINSKTEKVSEEQAALMKQCFIFINQNYLDLDSKRDARPALLNLLQLTYNNTLDLNLSVYGDEVMDLDKTYIRDTVCE
mmetsp:Transcript_6656/g.11204  ORF Transcript_6656/g.11204 Transcript_6656/m.11204 type:complete len:314 (-) Transcript_6656:124-1065(-)|eukprot:CAMPEP_0168620032 /NCGR_PEP_ID=MMETSP0449_2-20121227/6918_1 /TAXON_ID=1082188 /ORGANISM="Strombidium rassoulzadegani, Strain ras09" /LENGTH=313 /DNA_ID=CAMNT_0008661005 /DNA_START=79 /DNA_END=1020 /DNA_ORIENTATION=-